MGVLAVAGACQDGAPQQCDSEWTLEEEVAVPCEDMVQPASPQAAQEER